MPDTSLQQYFGNLGGPVIKDKLWFFLSDDFFGNFDKSSQQSIDWLTVPGGERRVSTNDVFGKITFTPFKNHTLSLSGTLDKFLHQSGGIGVPEAYTKTTYKRYSYRLNYRGILSQNTLLTLAWGQNRNDTNTQPLSGNFGPPPYFWQDIGQTTSNAYDSYGFLPYSVDHVVKLAGIYFAHYGFNVSPNIEYLSGYHWEKKGWCDAYGNYCTFPEGRGGRTTPPHMYVDLAIEKDFRLKGGLALGLGVNIYNLMNSQRPVSFVKEDNSLFWQVWARQLPRWIQIKATLKF